MTRKPKRLRHDVPAPPDDCSLDESFRFAIECNAFELVRDENGQRRLALTPEAQRLLEAA